MVFGTTTFKCDNCGNKFIAPAAEWCATCFIAPMPCPKCGSKYIQKLRRVTGYLTGNYTTAFNPGKIEETNLRKKHLKLEIEKENENGGN